MKRSFFFARGRRWACCGAVFGGLGIYLGVLAVGARLARLTVGSWL